MKFGYILAAFACLAAAGRRSSGTMAAASSLDPLVRILGSADDLAIQRDVLRGMLAALGDRRAVPMPAGWPAAYRKLEAGGDAEIRQDATRLALLFGDPQALRALRGLAADRSADAPRRQAALQSLAQANAPDLAPLLHGLLADPAMAGPALRALAACGDHSTPGVILGRYARFTPAERGDALMTLASRPASALALLGAVADGKVSRQDLTAFHVRQMANLGDPRVDEALKRTWGPIRGASRDKLALLDQYKKKFTPDAMGHANLSNGRAVFARACGVCHTLFNAGGQVGPNLTGAQRSNMDYVLGKVLDPSAVVSPDYRMTILRTKDGRVINGIVQQESPAAVTLKAPNQTIVVQKDDIEKRKLSDLSLMPEGLLGTMSDDETRDLLAYLASAGQVPLQGK